jgi:4-hydroxy-tetrahydrodipicolinate synthase
MKTKLRGAMTALVTPFDDAGEIDRKSLRDLVGWQIECGIHGLVPAGTTGEGATLTDDEQRVLIETVVEETAGRVPVIAGCGTNDTRRTIEGAERAAKAGANALLVVSPYYNKPNRSGMLAHYQAVCGATDLPIVVYNVPGRTGQNLGVDGILELAELSGVIAVKEASADLEQVAEILEGCSPDLALLSGDDALALPAMALGADGVISVVSNEDPGGMARLIEAATAGDFSTAREEHFRLLPLMRANFVESNPVPVKTAMAMLGRCSSVVRAPLGSPVARTKKTIESALAFAGLTAITA